MGLSRHPRIPDVGNQMSWRLGPVSDCVWVFSGLPLGLVFALGLIPLSVLVPCFIAINTAHLLAPVAMAWSHRGFRIEMRRHKSKFVALPLALIVLGLIAAGLSWALGDTIEINQVTLAAKFLDASNMVHPLGLLAAVYFVWNLYHFGMQNYGFLRLYRPKLDKALAMQLGMFTTILLMIVLPEKFRIPQLFMFVLGAVIFQHQLAALGIAAHVWANHRRRSQLFFVAPLLVFGCLVSFGYSFLHSGWPLMLVIGLRATAGFGHFLYDRWVWRLSDPQVRATIGYDLFGPPKLVQKAAA